ncbi:TatD family hydrolase [Vibrio salinus]|uniref:TatD family hydrolase n=1 Tax=Vibrio salinus TaxID=2899784 RepID=UPI001E391631|nr:TatD family hydrolase [Vibrio salinus]MCE0494297.1 TatD family hydrolase [Vibrio salinus]
MKNANSPCSFLVDTHCHFDFDAFSSSFSSELEEAINRGIRKLIVPSVGVQNWRRVETLSEQYPGIIYHALGIHPYFLSSVDERILTEFQSAVDRRQNSCVAIGECGLDATVNIPLEKQQDILTAQFDIAIKSSLPVILHSRKTHSQIAGMVRKYPALSGGVVHAFTGSYQQAKVFVDLGLKIGVGGTITYPRANKTRQAISQLPLESLVLETDAPDMPVSGHQGMPNHPKYLQRILLSLTELRSEKATDVVKQLWINSHSLFQLPIDR